MDGTRGRDGRFARLPLRERAHARMMEESRASLAGAKGRTSDATASFGTALLAHALFIPLWTCSPLPPLAGVLCLLCGRPALGVLILTAFVAFNSLPRHAERPWITSAILRLGMRKFYARCELRGALHSMGAPRAMYCFHPHGVLAAGFVVNGCWC